jgi:hypothetical protein
MKNGFGKYFYKEGGSFEGIFKNNKAEGKGIEISRNGDRF